MSARVDFTSQAFFRDERLRGIGPVVRTKFPIIGTVWITTTYELTARVLKDSETFTLRKERHVRSSSAILQQPHFRSPQARSHGQLEFLGPRLLRNITRRCHRTRKSRPPSRLTPLTVLGQTGPRAVRCVRTVASAVALPVAPKTKPRTGPPFQCTARQAPWSMCRV
jgi:hypothetical protein